MDYENYETILAERRGRILTLTLNRPNELNAVDKTLHEELARIFGDVQLDDGADVIVLTAAGRAFSAGGDLKYLKAVSEGTAELPSLVDAKRIVFSLLDLEKPIIARVNGHAMGLGATLALFCDVVVASDAAFFNDSHVQVGLVAGDGSSVIWPMLIGIARAKEFLFTADRIGAADAVRLGLVNHAVAADELTKFTLALAAKIASQPAFATRATKASVNRQLRRAVSDGMDVGAAWQRISNSLPDHEAAVRAFMERRRK